jgi:transcriptional regulator with XRE-family HTH domain
VGSNLKIKNHYNDYVEETVPSNVKSGDPIDLYVGSRLKSRRQQLGLSQEKLGEAVHLTFQQIQKYEQGTNRISCSRIYHFAKLLDVEVSYFFKGCEKPTVSKTYLINDVVEELNDNKQQTYTAGMSDKEIESVIKLLNSIKKPSLRKFIIATVKKLVKEMN